MKSVTINPAKSLSGEIHVPGDKSISHRSLIFASLAAGTSTIKNLLLGEDVLNTMRILQKLGVKMSHKPEELKEGDILKVEGGTLSPTKDILDCGNSGTTMRLLLGFLSGYPFESVLTGDASLNKRPMDRVIKPLTAMGARFEITEEKGRRLIRVKGTDKLKGIKYDLPVASAQLKSALLLAGLHAEGETVLTEPEPSRDHTERMLAAMGAGIRKEGYRCFLKMDSPPTAAGNDKGALKPFQMEVPSDFSSAAFFLVAGLIVPHSKLLIRSVGVNPTRCALLDVLRSMGGKIEEKGARVVSGEPVADLLVTFSQLKGVSVGAGIIPNIIDELPIFAVAASHAEGVSEVSGAGELRVKESDRIATLASEMKKGGTDFEEKKDGFKIRGGKPFQAGEFTSHGDHRIAMSLAIASLTGKKPSLLKDIECVSTSFPSFFTLLKSSPIS